MSENTQYSIRLTDSNVVEIFGAEGVWVSIVRSKSLDFQYDIYNGPVAADGAPDLQLNSFDQVAAATQQADVNTDDLQDLIDQL